MRKIFYCLTIAATVVLLRFNASASAPAGYYKSLNGLSGQALKDAVHNLIAPHTVVTYNSLWYYFPSTDHMPDNDSRVWDMYSDNAYYYNGSGSAVKGMNREHSFPKYLSPTTATRATLHAPISTWPPATKTTPGNTPTW